MFCFLGNDAGSDTTHLESWPNELLPEFWRKGGRRTENSCALLISGSSQGWIFAQYTGTERLGLNGWMDFLIYYLYPCQKIWFLCGKPGWGRLGARLQFNTKVSQVSSALREKTLSGSSPRGSRRFTILIVCSFFSFPGLRFELCGFKRHCLFI